MTNKYFNYQGAFWQIFETTDPWGKPLTYAVEMDSTEGVMLGTDEYADASDWEYVEARDVRIDEWFLKSDPNDLFEAEEDDDFLEEQQKYVDMMSKVQSMTNQSSRLKEMLENLQQPVQPNGTIGRAEDILGMIRARQETVEMPPTVILNENKYPDSASLETAINDMKQRHGDHAHIRIGKHGADDLLATYKNQETIGLSSIMDSAQGINIDFDAETLELIMMMKSKK